MPLLSHPLCGGAIRWATPACHKQMIDSCGRGQALSDLLSKNTVDFFKSAHLTAQQQTHALMHRNSQCGRSYRRSVQLSPSLRTALLSVSRPPVTAPVHTSQSRIEISNGTAPVRTLLGHTLMCACVGYWRIRVLGF